MRPGNSAIYDFRQEQTSPNGPVADILDSECALMLSEYIEQRDGGYYLIGTRISLDSIVYSFNRGNSPESIQAEYPLLKQAQIYGAIAFYLDHKAEIDEYLTRNEREFETSAIPLEQADPALWEKLQRARAKLSEPRS